MKSLRVLGLHLGLLAYVGVSIASLNLDARRGNAPQLVLHDGHVLVFYAEQLHGGKWRHWQRRLGAAGATSGPTAP